MPVDWISPQPVPFAVLTNMPQDPPYLQICGPDGNSRKQRNDCVVKAISYTTDIPYWMVSDVLNNLRIRSKPNTGYYPPEYLRGLQTLGVDVVHHEFPTKFREGFWRGHSWVRGSFVSNGPTITQFAQENPTDRYLVCSRGHMMGIRDGKIGGTEKRFRLREAYLLTTIDGKSL